MTLQNPGPDLIPYFTLGAVNLYQSWRRDVLARRTLPIEVGDDWQLGRRDCNGWAESVPSLDHFILRSTTSMRRPKYLPSISISVFLKGLSSAPSVRTRIWSRAKGQASDMGQVIRMCISSLLTVEIRIWTRCRSFSFRSNPKILVLRSDRYTHPGCRWKWGVLAVAALCQAPKRARRSGSSCVRGTRSF